MGRIIDRRRNMGNYKPTVIWNQMFDRKEFKRGTTFNGITYETDWDNSFSLTANGTSTSSRNWYFAVGYNKNIEGHIYVMYTGIKGNRNFYVEEANSVGFRDYGDGCLFTSGRGTFAIGIFVRTDFTVNNEIVKPNLFDLTLMFGAGKEPTLAQFKQWFVDNIGSLDGDYPFNTGEKIKVKYLPEDM